ncbi:hypothetical protein D6779_08120 [Candidatus Parcubacteria bacterium]|nr:MAG: hypothetical protein D6779_08120 [Candidatus Parcubacteria bacterium]
MFEVIAAYLIFFTIGTTLFFWMAKLNFWLRIVIALAVFLIPAITLTFWVARNGDRPPSDAIIVFPKLPEENDRNIGGAVKRNKKDESSSRGKD